MAEKSEAFKNLEKQLKDMFQLDRGDLDFGIYRIMNHRHDEIANFLENELLPQVQTVLAEYQPEDMAEKRQELAEAERNPNKYAADYIEGLRQAVETGFDAKKTEQEIYSDLYNFFRRYYSEGDFMALRRYKQGVYALPYEGEEVKLYWANADQYYIKTAENFRNYSFKTAKGKKIRFEIIAAATEKNNNKATEDKARRFVLTEHEPLKIENNELVIRFEYRAADGAKQTDLNKETLERILPTEEAAEFGLDKQAPTENNKTRTILEKHLTDFTAKNSFDYFIHKDLGGFLRRELDFYIKNEIMQLDDIEEASAPRVDAYLGKIRAMRRVADKIIEFLAQLEDFQKRLWLKKKFVLEANYCLTLDHIIEKADAAEVNEILAEIAANNAQRREWVKLFAIDEIESDLAGQVAYSAPLSVKFLRAHGKLPVDTKFFDAEFKYRILSLFDDLDGETDGLLIESENFQALNLLQARYSQQVKCIYIDPPYNTGNDGFLYKDGYPHSTWLSMMESRLNLGRNLCRNDAATFISIDDNEQANLKELCDEVFGEGNFIANIVWEKRYGRSNDAKLMASLFDHLMLYRSSPELKFLREPRTESSNAAYSNPDNDFRGAWTSVSFVSQRTKEERRNLSYSIVNPTTGEEITHETNSWKYNKEKYEEMLRDNRFYWGKDGTQKYPRIKRFLSELADGLVPVNLWKHQDTGTGDEGVRELNDFFGKETFTYPKPTRLLKRIMGMADKDSLILDYFAGSGTTGHAVINLNREDDGARKYILVEMGGYFNSVLKPRILKAVYAKDWKAGKPTAHNNGVRQLIKYMSLEQYEDTLDNLTLAQPKAQGDILESHSAFKQHYMLSYMLDSQARESLLNSDAFADPFSYSLMMTRNDERQKVKVDLVETFNYLLGLRVHKIDHHKKGALITVEGKNALNENCLIIWRNIKQVDNDALNKWFDSRDYSVARREFDAVYVNGDNNLQNLRQNSEGEETEALFKLRLIEAEFKRLMFAAKMA